MSVGCRRDVRVIGIGGARRTVTGAVLALAVAVGLSAPASADGPADPTPEASTFGVATFNLKSPRMRTQAGRKRMALDVSRLASTPGVDVIGFQEGQRSRRLLRRALEPLGWRVYTPKRVENPIAWRADRFALAERAGARKVWTMSAGSRAFGRPFPSRYLTRVLLTDRTSGALVAVHNTHLNQLIERRGVPRDTQTWRRADQHLAAMGAVVRRSPGSIAVLTGDFNIDARSDAKVRNRSMPYRRYAGLMESSYKVLGFPRAATSAQHDPYRRAWIDYVWLRTSDRTSDRTGARMIRQRVASGYRTGRAHSDHAPLIVTLSATG